MCSSFRMKYESFCTFSQTHLEFNLWARCCFSFLSSTFFRVRDLSEVHLLICLHLTSVFSFLLPSSHHRSSSDSSPFFLTFCTVFLCELEFSPLKYHLKGVINSHSSLPTFSRCLGRKSQECKSYSSTSSHNLRGYTSFSSSFDNFATFSRNLAKCRVAESV